MLYYFIQQITGDRHAQVDVYALYKMCKAADVGYKYEPFHCKKIKLFKNLPAPFDGAFVAIQMCGKGEDVIKR